MSEDEDIDTSSYENELKELLDIFANVGRLKYFTYALYGESRVILPESAWAGLHSLSNGLEGLHVDVHPIHWVSFDFNNYITNFTHVYNKALYS